MCLVMPVVQCNVTEADDDLSPEPLEHLEPPEPLDEAPLSSWEVCIVCIVVIVGGLPAYLR